MSSARRYQARRSRVGRTTAPPGCCCFWTTCSSVRRCATPWTRRTRRSQGNSPLAADALRWSGNLPPRGGCPGAGRHVVSRVGGATTTKGARSRQLIQQVADGRVLPLRRDVDGPTTPDCAVAPAHARLPTVARRQWAGCTVPLLGTGTDATVGLAQLPTGSHVRNLGRRTVGRTRAATSSGRRHLVPARVDGPRLPGRA